MLQYLSEVAGSVSGVEQQILQSNPILEAFGNAKTLRNNNSSRFGKWLSIHFQPVPYKGAPATSGPGRKIVAARIVNYLLEKSRVTQAGANERSYHIFYQLLAGASPELKAQLSLGAPSDYTYLRQSGCYDVAGVDEVEEFAATTHAMQALQFPPEVVAQIWQLLAAILQIGNLQPQSNPQKSDVTLIANKDALSLTTKTLGLSSDMVLASALCYRSVTIRGSISMIPLNVAEVEANRDALSKTLYAKLFDHLIVRMNQVLFTAQGGEDHSKSTEQSRAHARSIGILDIFGQTQGGSGGRWAGGRWGGAGVHRASEPRGADSVAMLTRLCWVFAVLMRLTLLLPLGFEIFESNLFEQVRFLSFTRGADVGLTVPL